VADDDTWSIQSPVLFRHIPESRCGASWNIEQPTEQDEANEKCRARTEVGKGRVTQKPHRKIQANTQYASEYDADDDAGSNVSQVSHGRLAANRAFHYPQRACACDTRQEDT
jgi:hypothetical protein